MPGTKSKRQRPTRKKNNLTPEGRQKLSDLAKQRHADGKLGGPEFGKLGGRGNTRAKRLAQQSVANAASADIENIVKVFKDAISPTQPMGMRLRGAELWLTVEGENAKLALAEQRATGEQWTREQLIEILAGKLTNGPTASLIRAQLEEPVVDAEVVEE